MPGIDFLQVVVAQAVARHGAGAQVLDDHVGVAGELPEDAWPSGVLSARVSERRLTLRVRKPRPILRFQELVAHLGMARRIAFVGILDGDHVRAVHREMTRRERRGDDAGDGEDLDAGEELSRVSAHVGRISSVWNLQRRFCAETEGSYHPQRRTIPIQEESMSLLHPAGRVAFASALLAALCAAGALAQSYPVKPIRLVVPFPAGASSDVVGRMLGTEDLGADGPAGHRGQSRRRRRQPGHRRRGQVTARRLHDPDRHGEHRRESRRST